MMSLAHTRMYENTEMQRSSLSSLQQYLYGLYIYKNIANRERERDVGKPFQVRFRWWKVPSTIGSYRKPNLIHDRTRTQVTLTSDIICTKTGEFGVFVQLSCTQVDCVGELFLAHTKKNRSLHDASLQSTKH